MTPWRNRHAVRTFAGAAVVALVAVLVSASAQAAGHGGPRHTLTGTKPSWTGTLHDRGAVDGAVPFTRRCGSRRRTRHSSTRSRRRCRDPSSRSTASSSPSDQYNAQFAPTQDSGRPGEAVARLGRPERRLGRGLTTTTWPSRAPRTRSMPRSRPRSRRSSSRDRRLGATTDLSVPDALSDVVLAVSGITTFGHKLRPADFGAPTRS